MAARPETKVVAFKVRAWVVGRGDLLRQAAPQAKVRDNLADGVVVGGDAILLGRWRCGSRRGT